jgi:AcrR family transcriptional regulator
MGPEDADTRSVLLDIAEQLMRDEGYVAVTSRQLARAANMSPQIVYYYFRTMDELFEAVFARVADYHMKAIARAADAPDPLTAVWKLSSEPPNAVIISELMALSNHRKGLRTLISEFGRDFHARQAEIVEAEFARRGVDTGRWPPAMVAAIMEAVARSFALGQGFDLPGQARAREFIERLLEAGPELSRRGNATSRSSSA